jgi:hypothetical protein
MFATRDILRTRKRLNKPASGIPGSAYILRFFSSSTAWLAARAVSAIKVKVGFCVPVEVIQAPSVTNTFLQWCSWFHLFNIEVFGSSPMRIPLKHLRWHGNSETVSLEQIPK